MKKKRVLLTLACVVAFLALFAIFFRHPSFGPDVSLVQGVPMFSYHAADVNGQMCIQRSYVLHMSYKDAVWKLGGELAQPPWEALKFGENPRLFFWKNDHEFIEVRHCRRVAGVWLPNGNRTVGFVQMVMHPDLDPRGWVVITTTRPLTGIAPTIAKIRSRIRIPIKGGPRQFTELWPMEGITDDSPPRLEEDDSCHVTWNGDLPFRHP